MSGSEQTKLHPNSDQSIAGVGYYVYCISDAARASQIVESGSPVPIEDGATLELIERKHLSAVVSRVPLSSYGEEPLAELLTDGAWTAVRAMRHEHVVEFFSKRTSVVPLRFGTIYLDRSGVEQMLNEKSGQLTEIIHRLEGREEWGVNVYCDRTLLLENITSVSPRLRQMTEEAKQASPGQSYLMQKKIEVLRADEAKAEIARAADEIENQLRSVSDDSVRLRILKVESTENGELKAKFAFLVSKSNFENFRNAAEGLARNLGTSGIKIELTGPWPAYNFATA